MNAQRSGENSVAEIDDLTPPATKYQMQTQPREKIEVK